MVTYFFIKYLIYYIQSRRIIEQVYKEENIIHNLSELFGIQFRKDWIGRLYAIFNPLLNVDQNDLIFDSSPEGYTLQSFVEKRILEKMIIADGFIKDKTLFELVTYHIDGLDDDYNFLFTITPIAWFDFWKWTKRFLLLISILLIIGITLLIIL